MPSYAQAVTNQEDQLFLRCGTKEVAGNLASEASEGSGADFALVLAANFNVLQPYDLNANSYNAAGFSQLLTVVVPNYQPVQSMALNIMNERKTIAKLILNYVAIKPGGVRRQLVGQYTFSNGILTSYDCQPGGNGEGQIALSFVFEKMAHANLATHTAGSMTVTQA